MLRPRFSSLSFPFSANVRGWVTSYLFVTPKAMNGFPRHVLVLPEELVALLLSLLHSREVGEVGRSGSGRLARLAGEELSSRAKPRVFTELGWVHSCDFSPAGESAEFPSLPYRLCEFFFGLPFPPFPIIRSDSVRLKKTF